MINVGIFWVIRGRLYYKKQEKDVEREKFDINNCIFELEELYEKYYKENISK